MIQLSYKRIRSNFHNIQKFVNYIMLEVVLRASKMEEKQFDVSMIKVDRYRRLVEEVDNSYLLDPLSTMYKEIKVLNSRQVRLFRKAVYCNNKIQDLCERKIVPIHYSDLKMVLGNEHDELIKAIKHFCYSLYDYCVRRAPFYHEFGKIDDYYKGLVNRNSTCVMCGVPKRILTSLDDKMSAFDHYLPRALYPFNSVNTANLIPTCDICNQKYKGVIDPLFETSDSLSEKKQLLSFFPFSQTVYDIKIEVDLLSDYTQNMSPNEFSIRLSCDGVQEKVDNWDRIYSIKKRYAKACCEDDFFDTYKMAFINCSLYNITTRQYIQLLEKNMKGDLNFLKVPFLKAIIKKRGY